jgi:hypothetical protein
MIMFASTDQAQTPEQTTYANDAVMGIVPSLDDDMRRET